MTSGEPRIVLPLTLLASQAEEHAANFLGLPLWLWQLANLVLFLGVLLYFVARPMAAMFRQRQLDVEKRSSEAKALREEAAQLGAQVRERMSRLDQEIADQVRKTAADLPERSRALAVELAEKILGRKLAA